MKTTDCLEYPSEKLFDLSYVERIARGETTVLNKLLTTFIDTIPAATAQLEAAYAQQDFVRMRSIVHKIKPVLSVYAVVSVEQELQLIQRQAEAGTDTTAMAAAVQKTKEVVHAIARSIEHTINHPVKS